MSDSIRSYNIVVVADLKAVTIVVEYWVQMIEIFFDQIIALDNSMTCISLSFVLTLTYTVLPGKH